jgi:DNA-binding transcriptional ArsR family regulator
MPLAESTSPFVYGVEPKLASALTDPIRVRILEELQARPLSPSQFVRERGGDLNHVARGFRYLKTCGYAEVTEERQRVRGGSSIEHVYRLVEGPETAGWLAATLPIVGHDSDVGSNLSAYWSRIVEALAAGTFDNQIETHASWDTVVLDAKALEKLRERLDLATLATPRRDEILAADREEATAGESISATAGFSILRSPQTRDEIIHRFKRLPEHQARPFELGPEVANALANRWRSRILTELFSRPMSPSQFVERFGGDPSYIARCFRELLSWGLIELIEEKGGGRNGGGTERIFRNARHCYFDKTVWKTVPRFLRRAVSRGWATVLAERLEEVVRADLIDEEGLGLGVEWRTEALTPAAWHRRNEELDRILTWLPQLQKEALARAGGDPSGLEPILVSMACFESPRT